MERLKRGTKRLNMIIDLAYNLAFPIGITCPNNKNRKVLCEICTE